MGRELTINSRACTTSDGVVHPAEPLTAFYEDSELSVMEELGRRAKALPVGDPERAALVAEMHSLHEMKALLGLRPREVPVDESAVEVLAKIEQCELEYPSFKIPQRAKDDIAREGGQTVLPYESEPRGSGRDAGVTGSRPQETGSLPDAHPRPDFSDESMRADSDPPAWATPSAVSAPESAASRLPDFDGATYGRALDHERLGKQLLRVGRQMADGHWHTLSELAEKTGDPEASVSARIRDLRKRKFGGHTVNRERMEGGLWRYRLVREQFATPWGDEQEVQAA